MTRRREDEPGDEPVVEPDASGAESEQPGTPDQAESEAITEDAGAESAARGFTVEDFAKSLPDGMCVCPTCLAVGAVVEDPPFDPYTKACPRCLGYGQLRTGAQGGSVARQCPSCEGSGWVPREGGEPPASPARPSDLTGTLPPRDTQGRTPADPDFDWSAVVRDVEPAALPAEPAAAL